MVRWVTAWCEGSRRLPPSRIYFLILIVDAASSHAAARRQSTRMSRLTDSAHTAFALGIFTETVPPRRAGLRGALTCQPRCSASETSAP